MKRFLGLAVSPSSWIFTLILNVFILPICLLHFIHDAQAQFSDQELNTVNPQIKLTDGIYASNSNADSNWVYFDKDATMLPKTVYGDYEISFWGTNLGYVREPWYKLLEDANIKTIRYDISWSGLEKNGPITNDELNTNSYLLQAKELSDKGFNLIYTLNDTPPYANGNKNKGYWNQAVAPHRVIEEWEPDGELIDFSSNYTVQLQHAPGKAEEKPLLYTSLNPFFLLDVDDTTLKAQTTEHEEFCQFEMDDERQEPRICSLKNQPVQVGSEEIWLDFNGDGIYDNSEKWFRVNNWLDLDNPDKLPEDRRNVPRTLQQAYLISRDGIIKLPSWILYLFGYGKVIKPSLSPTKKIKMKVRYHSYITPSDGKGGSKYIEGVDYIVDDLNGKITWIPGFRLNVPKSNESFDTQ